MTEVIAAIIGAVIGFVLNEIIGYFRARREREEQSKSIRTMLRIEIDDNLQKLQDMHVRLSRAEEEAYGPKEIQLPEFLGRMSIPIWSHKLWESQLSNAPTALSDRIIRQVHDHHNTLEHITSTAYTISEVHNQVGYRLELYNECLELISRTLNNGNPIK